MVSGNQRSSPINKRHSIEELKIKYESTLADDKTMLIAPINSKSTKQSKTSKVKQIAAKFNSKLTQLLRRDAEVARYNILLNEFSPEQKEPSRRIKTKPIPKPRIRPPGKPPMPTPRAKTLKKIEQANKYSVCFVPEEGFARLSVKEKAQLYMIFVEEMTGKNPKFDLLKNKSISLFNSDIAKEEKQIRVKDLLEELEFNSVFPKIRVPAAQTLQRMESMKKACAARKYNNAFCNSAEPKRKGFKNVFKKKFNKEVQDKSFATADQTSETIFQNEQIENLFFSWYKEKHDSIHHTNDESNQSEMDEEKQKSSVERLLEEAIAHLENQEDQTKDKIELLMAGKNKISNLEAKSPRKLSASEEEESESGVSTLPKTTSEDSQPESLEKTTDKSENDLVTTKSLKSVRRKKFKKVAVVSSPIKNKRIHSTDSESDGKQTDMNDKKTKVLINTSAQENAAIEAEDPRLENLLRSLNSPHKIKSNYTLTINDLETPLNTPRPSVNFNTHPLAQHMMASVTENFTFSDSFTDQGFETATESPLKNTTNQTYTPPPTSATFSYTNDSLASQTQQEQQRFLTALDISFKNMTVQEADTNSKQKPNMKFSTPIKTQERHSFAATNSAKRLLFSPIAKPTTNRRKSMYDGDFRRNSSAMQVIREDQPLETTKKTSTNNISNKIEQNSSENTSAKINKPARSAPSAQTTSQFWLKCGEFSVTLDIDCVDPIRLRLLHEIFSKTSCDTRDLHFGIDNNKFSVGGSLEDIHNQSNRVSNSKGCSHYWFSTGHLTIPFDGKLMLPNQIQNLFRFVREAIEETGVLRFGVDKTEFSDVAEFWYQTPKFSIDSQYSMLVGLQTGESNGLEGRSKYSWPHIKRSENEANNFEEGGRVSNISFNNTNYDLFSLDNDVLNMPRDSLTMFNVEFFGRNYKNGSLDKLFDANQVTQSQPQNDDLKRSKSLSIPEMISSIKNEKQRLRKMKNNLLSTTLPPNLAIHQRYS